MPDEELQFEPFQAQAQQSFRTKKRTDEDELDMTPMVDVTFLLLIFFMVTAAFSLQKTISSPPPDEQESAIQTLQPEELNEDDYVIVEIHSDNSIFVNENEAPSEQELLVKLREARQGVPGSDSGGPSSLLVKAEGGCRHETVVMVLDARQAVGMESVRLVTLEDSDF